MYWLNIFTLYLFDLCSWFIGVRKWRVLDGLNLNYKWGLSAKSRYRYTATVMGRVAEQWGRQPSGWWGLRASLSMGCVFYTIVMANGVGWPSSNIRHASRWHGAIHVHVPIAIQWLSIYTKTIIFINMTTRDLVSLSWDKWESFQFWQ